jgi:hypothetical protein
MPALASFSIFSGLQKIIRGVAGVAARLARVTDSGHSISLSLS